MTYMYLHDIRGYIIYCVWYGQTYSEFEASTNRDNSPFSGAKELEPFSSSPFIPTIAVTISKETTKHEFATTVYGLRVIVPALYDIQGHASPDP